MSGPEMDWRSVQCLCLLGLAPVNSLNTVELKRIDGATLSLDSRSFCASRKDFGLISVCLMFF